MIVHAEALRRRAADRDAGEHDGGDDEGAQRQAELEEEPGGYERHEARDGARRDGRQAGAETERERARGVAQRACADTRGVASVAAFHGLATRQAEKCSWPRRPRSTGSPLRRTRTPLP